MPKDFAHLNDSAFPNVGNVDVYKYQNQMDYQRFAKEQMRVTVLNVPWDMGEAHVGQRTISGIGNVVMFEAGKEGRDAWFESVDDKVVLSTQYRKYHDEDRVRLPIPFDVLSRYNYLTIEYAPSPGEEPYLEYERDSHGIRKWFYFIRDIRRIADNTTEAVVKRDTWQTIVYDVEIPYMMLEQGHAPMSKSPLDEYIASPAKNTRWLKGIEPDEIGDDQLARSAHYIELSKDCAPVVISATSAKNHTYSDMNSNDAGSWEWTHATVYRTQDGVPSLGCFALADASALNTLLKWVEENHPQYLQGIKAIIFVPRELISFGESWAFGEDTSCPVECYGVHGLEKSFDLVAVEPSQFNYPEEYEWITKLYTWPYAHLEFTDSEGRVTIVKIESLADGYLKARAQLSIAYPSSFIRAFLENVGLAGNTTLHLDYVSSKSQLASGAWYDTVTDLEIPTYGIVQKPRVHARFHDAPIRESEQVNAREMETATKAVNNAATTSGDTRADAARDNAKNSAATAQSNANAEANVVTSNATLTSAANIAVTARSNTASLRDTQYGNALNQALQAWSAGYTRQTTNNDVNAEYASAAVGAAGGAIGSIASGAVSGGVAGAVGGAISGAISGATTMVQTSIAANLKTTQAEAGITFSQNQLTETNTSNTDRNGLQRDANTDNTATNAGLARSTAKNTSDAMTANATRSYNTDAANADRTYNANHAALVDVQTEADDMAEQTRENAIRSIEGQYYASQLDAPAEYGAWTSQPHRAMFVGVSMVTATDGAIAMAGDRMLRYGYMFNGAWKFEGFNLMPKFTYWKCADLWVRNLSIPDLLMDELRFFLMGGVTVWRNPSDIGNISIYENR